MRIAAYSSLAVEDRDALLTLWVRAWTPVVQTIDFEGRRAWLSEHLDSLMSGGATMLIGRDATGFAVGFLTVDPRTGVVDQLAVDPAFAGHGFAHALMQEAKRLSPRGLSLRVTKLNERAFGFYQRAGFVVTGEDVSARSGLPVWTMAWPRAASPGAFQPASFTSVAASGTPPK